MKREPRGKGERREWAVGGGARTHSVFIHDIKAVKTVLLNASNNSLGNTLYKKMHVMLSTNYCDINKGKKCRSFMEQTTTWTCRNRERFPGVAQQILFLYLKILHYVSLTNAIKMKIRNVKKII